MSPAPDGGVAQTANTLRIIQLAMAGGIVMMAAVSGFIASSSVRVPGPQELGTIRLLSIVDLVFAAGAVAAAPLVYRSARGASPTLGSLQSARIARAALGEGAALLGATVCFLAGSNGALRAEPLYWLNAVPAVVFVAWAVKTLPTEDDLRAELGP